MFTSRKQKEKKPLSEDRISMSKMTTVFLILLCSVFIILLLVKFFVFRNEFTLLGFFNDMIDSLIGIIIPMLLFDIFYGYLTNIYAANETSEKIANVIMGDKEALMAFDVSTRQDFLRSTIKSFIGDRKGTIVSGLIAPYISKEVNFRSNFKYIIMLKEFDRATGYEPFISAEKLSQEYYSMEQVLCYTKEFNGNVFNNGEATIVFVANNNEFEEHFKSQGCLFTEELFLDPAFAEKVKENTYDFVLKSMAFSLHINDCLVKLERKHISWQDGQIVLRCQVGALIQEASVKVKITFNMPRSRDEKSFVTVLSDPTFSPQITFTYPHEKMDLNVVPFFDETIDESNCTMANGYYQINIDKWVFPRSGIVFNWRAGEHLPERSN